MKSNADSVSTTVKFSRPGHSDVTYHVRLNKRYGFSTREAYAAEVDRLIRLGEESDATVTVTHE